MLIYLIILLDDTAVSYCHYEVKKKERWPISLDDLRGGILFAMKENLNVQFVYPDYDLPEGYKEAIDTIDHTDIKPLGSGEGDVRVIEGFGEIPADSSSGVCVLRTDKAELFSRYTKLIPLLRTAMRVNVVITDIETFTDDDFETYKRILDELNVSIEQLYVNGQSPQLNLLTDRMMLTEMNNCGAGDTTITIAPDGKFYVCPAFYYAGQCNGKEKDEGEVCQKGYSIGSLADGLDINSPQLYKLDHAPICRHCDAWQCKRCIWLNRKTTLEVNTPSHEQCVVAHLERNASRRLLQNIRKHGSFLSDVEDINNINYLDPFDNREKWKINNMHSIK